MASTNLNYAINQRAIWREIMKLLEGKLHNRWRGEKKTLSQKAGAPATNTTGDQAEQLYDMCWDSTNGEVYICTLTTDDTTHTWVKITD